MPIYFEELEQVLEKWKKSLNIKTPNNKIGKIVYDELTENINIKFTEKITNLFSKITMSDIIIETEEVPCKTYGEFKEIKHFKLNIHKIHSKL